MTAPVFISYKTGDPDTQAFLDVLLPRLASFDVRIDHGFIDPGDPWRRRVFIEAHICRAAVMLLSPAAVRDSKWVPVEASILRSRQLYEEAIGRKLPIVPVRLGGLDAQALTGEPWATIQLLELQLTTLPSGADAATLASTADRVVAALGDLHAPESDGEKLRRRVAHMLRSVPDDVAWRVLDGLEPTSPPRHRSPQGALATALLSPPSLEAWQDAARDLVPYLGDDAADLLRRALPPAWIPSQLADAAHDGGRPRPAVRLAAAYANLTPAHVLAAARPSDLLVHLQPLAPAAGESEAADLLAQLRASVAAAVGRPGRDDDATLRRRLAERVKGGDPFRVVLSGVEDSTVQTLRTQWPDVHLFLVADRGPADVHALPPLPDGLEDEAADVHDAVDEWIQRERATR